MKMFSSYQAKFLKTYSKIVGLKYGKYYFYTGLVLGGVFLNNYEETFEFLKMPNCFPKRLLDKLFGNVPLDPDTQINIYKEATIENEDLSNRTAEEILQLNNIKVKERKTIRKKEEQIPTTSIQKINEEEGEVLKSLTNTKDQIIIEILNIETKLVETFRERTKVAESIKAELENQSSILESIYKKLNKSNANEISQYEELMEDIENSKNAILLDLSINLPEENILTLKDLNDKQKMNRVTKDKKLEIMRSYMANYKPELISSHEKFEKFKNSYEQLTKDIRSKQVEIQEKEKNLEKLSSTELDYYNRKKVYTNQILDVNFKKLPQYEITHQKSESKTYSPNLLMNNEKQMINVIAYLFNQLERTNNRNNLNLYNKTLQFFNKKVYEISYIIQDDFVIDLLTRGKLISKRLYSHIEIENEFQHVKRKVYFNLLANEMKKYNMDRESALVQVICGVLCRAAELHLRWIGCKVNSINENDSVFSRNTKALSSVNHLVKSGKYPEAFTTLKFLSEGNVDGCLNELKFKLSNMTQESYALDLLKNHLN